MEAWKQEGLDEGRYIEGVREGVMNSVYDHQFPHRPVSLSPQQIAAATLEAAADSLTFCRLTAKSRFFLSAVKRRVGKEREERGERKRRVNHESSASAINYEAVKERNRLQMRMRCSRAEGKEKTQEFKIPVARRPPPRGRTLRRTTLPRTIRDYGVGMRLQAASDEAFHPTFSSSLLHDL